MNFALIPFFLAANIAVDRPNEWIHGPEYMFHSNLTYLLLNDVTQEPDFKVNMTRTMRCRPEAEERLLCRLVAEEIGNGREDLDLDLPFLVEFSRRGVESLRFQEVIDNERLNIIRSIVKELSVGADLKGHANSLPAFVARENYVFGECATLFTILEHDKPQNRMNDDEGSSNGGANYKLEILSLPNWQPDSVVVIEKRTEHKRCTKPNDAFSKKSGLDIKIKKSISRMQISDTTFRSETELNVKMKKALHKDCIVHNTVYVEFVGVEAAKEPLPPSNFDKFVSIRFNDEMDDNLVT